MKYWNRSALIIISVLIFSILYFHREWIASVLSDNNAPAWGQVFSALIAVLVAMWIARRDVRYREKAEAAAAKKAKHVFISHNKALIKSDLIRLSTVIQNLKDFSNPKKNPSEHYRHFFINIGNVYFLRFVDVAGSYDVSESLPNEIIEAKILLMRIYRGLEKPEARDNRIMDEEFSRKIVKSKEEMENDYIDYKDSENRRLSEDGTVLFNDIEKLKASLEKIDSHLVYSSCHNPLKYMCKCSRVRDD